MSIENRSCSALFKRADQLKRWQESETAKEPSELKRKNRRVQFGDGCIFLAACASSDRAEVEALVARGSDIDTCNVDGLTALHQACIDDNLEMVEFLVQRGADVNKGDNEGWTPLHATASCGFLSIARYLIEQNSNVYNVNNDGELPIDISESDEMEELLQKEMDRQGIDADACRNCEELLMLTDAANLIARGEPAESIPVHPRTGATSLHVAAAKGYIKVIRLLIQAGCKLGVKDNDDWTPLHAASHWGQREACQILVEAGADMESKNIVSQTCFDVADQDVLPLLEDLMKKRTLNSKLRPTIERSPIMTSPIPGMGSGSSKRRSSITRLSVDDKALRSKEDTSFERDSLKSSSLVNETIQEHPPLDRLPSEKHSFPKQQLTTTATTTSNNATSYAVLKAIRKNVSDPSLSEYTEQMPYKSMGNARVVPGFSHLVSDEGKWHKVSSPSSSLTTLSSSYKNLNVSNEQQVHPWRRPASLRARQTKPGEGTKEDKCEEIVSIHDELSLRRVRSFESTDQKKRETEDESSSTHMFRPKSEICIKPQQASMASLRRSFVPPVRDEESETQRKAHAKRVRETRRSTQGVSLEDLKSAEQLVKKKQQQENQQRTSELQQLVCGANHLSERMTGSNSSTSISSSGSLPNTPGPQSVSTDNVNAIIDQPSHERRPSWRLRLEGTDKNRFRLEDARLNENSVTSTASNLDVSESTNSNVPSISVTALQQSSSSTSLTDEKESAVSGIHQVIQRRRKAKRRSTGVVHSDDVRSSYEVSHQEETVKSVSEGNKTDVPVSLSNEAPPGEAVPASSGGGGSVSLRQFNSRTNTETSNTVSCTSSYGIRQSNGEIDYKKLWEESQMDNSRLRDETHKLRDDLHCSKSQLDNALQNNVKNSLSDNERREKRALEKKLSEMEEELKQLQKLKSDCERFKCENRALTRVVAKLTVSNPSKLSNNSQKGTGVL